jgi:hypothetical protein
MRAQRFLGVAAFVVMFLWCGGPLAVEVKRPSLDPASEFETQIEAPASDAAATQPPSIAGADTTWIVEWTFETSSGACDLSGWTHYDDRILEGGTP